MRRLSLMSAALVAATALLSTTASAKPCDGQRVPESNGWYLFSCATPDFADFEAKHKNLRITQKAPHYNTFRKLDSWIAVTVRVERSALAK
jgi:hypothetical protein